ncbi:hypothetical protein ACVCNR_00705 [Aquamicrobium terrae]
MKLTRSQQDALTWLKDHGGDGVFADKSHQVLYAQGEKAPFTRSTWNGLRDQGAVEFYGVRRARVVEASA